MRHPALFLASLTLLAAAPAYSGTVNVKGPHLCCGSCQTIADAALSEVDGVSAISCDLNTKVISYKADSDKSAAAGIKALAGAGFFGVASHDKKPLKYPVSGAKKGAKANTILLLGVHLCCGACVAASQKALEDVKGVRLIDIDRNEKTVKLTGDSIGVPEAIAALNKAGFFCRLPQPKK